MTNDEILIRIAEVLLSDYQSVYYVNAKTNEYHWYSSAEQYRSLPIAQEGKDFFENMKQDALKVVYDEDLHIFTDLMQKDNLLTAMKNGSVQKYEYRLMIDGGPVWHTIRVIRGLNSDSDDYFVLGILNIDNEVKTRLKAERLQKEREVFNQIADSLASNYDVIYYIDRDNSNYYAFETNPLYGQLEVHEAGRDFFGDAKRNTDLLVHPNDKERVGSALDRDTLISQLYRQKKYSINYRLVIDGKVKYTRFTAMWSGDKKHIVIGVENIDLEIQKEKDHLKALNSEKELARRDDLTGTKNKTAYLELTRSVQGNIDNGIDFLTFAIVVCDINGLKEINDTKGHQAGDDYIKQCAKLVCDIFTHSPVFRIGGDEFVVFIRGGDYACKDELFGKLRARVLENRATPGRAVVASGISAYDPSKDKRVAEVFKRADNMMYENKRDLKNEEPR